VYLEVYRRDCMSGGPTFVAKRVTVEGTQYGFIAIYHPVNPNDSKTNRGAYIASGSLFSLPWNLDQTLGALLCVMHNSGKLEAMRDTNNAFFPGFKVEAFPFSPYYPDLPARFLIDALCGVEQYVGELAERGFFYTVGTTAPVARDGSFYFIENDRAGRIERHEQEISLLRQQLKQTSDDLAVARRAYDDLVIQHQKRLRDQTLAAGYQGYNPRHRGTALALVEKDAHQDPGLQHRRPPHPHGGVATRPMEQPGYRRRKTGKHKASGAQGVTIGDYWRELQSIDRLDWLVTGITIALVLVVGMIFAHFIAKDSAYLRERNATLAQTRDGREALEATPEPAAAPTVTEELRDEADPAEDDPQPGTRSVETTRDRTEPEPGSALTPGDRAERDEEETPVAAARRQALEGD
jgi:hypothetical protein